MAKGRRGREKEDGDAGAKAADAAHPEPPQSEAAEGETSAGSLRSRTSSSSPFIFTPEGMVEEQEWRDPRIRDRPSAEKTFKELVASVLAGPPPEELAEQDSAATAEEFAEDVQVDPPEDPAETPADSGEGERRRVGALAVLGAAAFVLAAGAFLFATRGGGSETPDELGVAQSGGESALPPEGGGVPPADSQVAAQPPPAPEPVPATAPTDPPVPPPPSAPVVTAAPTPVPPPTAVQTPAPTPPPPPPAPPVIHVGDLDGGKPGRKVAITIYVHDAAHNPVAGVEVTGVWSGNYSGATSCVTDSSGSCAVRTQNLSASGSVTFTIVGLSSGGSVYDASLNHDPDGDSSGTSISIAV